MSHDECMDFNSCALLGPGPRALRHGRLTAELWMYNVWTMVEEPVACECEATGNFLDLNLNLSWTW
jgi:hypothetical protein